MWESPRETQENRAGCRRGREKEGQQGRGKEPCVRKNHGMTGGFYRETRHLQMLEMKATAGVLANGPGAPVCAVPCMDQRTVPDRMPPVMESRPLGDGKHLHEGQLVLIYALIRSENYKYVPRAVLRCRGPKHAQNGRRLYPVEREFSWGRRDWIATMGCKLRCA